MINLRKNTREYNQSIAHLQDELRQADELLKKDKQGVRADFKELVDAIYTTNEILTSRKNLSLSQTAQTLQDNLHA